MKTHDLSGASAPVRASSSPLGKLLDYFLPEDLRVRNLDDFYQLAAVCAVCATFIFPPAIIAAAYCAVKAGKGGKS
jgi:hypothetical protein